MIKYLTINEIEPLTEDSPIVNYSTVFTGEELKTEVHEFFKKHVENVYNDPKTRNGRFINKVSTILNSIEILFKSKTVDDINYDNIILPQDFNVEHKFFYSHSKIIVDLLAKNISKNVKNRFLFVVLHLEHVEHGELIALLKMESHFGVQFSKSELIVHLNMLPDKERDLQKCALIFKNQLATFPVDFDFSNNGSQFEFHTKILDKQDNTISQYFMTSFLDNNLITKDKENTKLASKHISNTLLQYAKEGITRPQIKSYIDNKLQYRNVTSVGSLIEDLIHNSNLIDQYKITKLNVDADTLRVTVYNNMLNENKSAQQSFTADPDFVEKRVIRDKVSSGKDLKVQIAQVMINKGIVKFDYTEENPLNYNDWMKIAIKRDIIDDVEGNDEETSGSIKDDIVTQSFEQQLHLDNPQTKQEAEVGRK